MKKDIHPWRTHNKFTLLRDGEQFFPIIFEKINEAKDFVLIEMYLISSGKVVDQLIEALTAAIKRGVAVYLLLDDYGARGLNKSDRITLKHLGAKICFYNRFHLRYPLRYLPRDHRKIICIDYATSFTGGLGFHDCFLSSDTKIAWRESIVQIEGRNCQDWVESFRMSWKYSTHRTLHLFSSSPLDTLYSQQGHVAISPTDHGREIRRNIIKNLRKAQKRIWLSTAYFVPSRKIRRLLRHAAKRGLDVRLILPGAYIDHPGVRYAGRRFYARLLHSNVKIYEYQPRFIHQKVVLIDNWVSIGSANMDRWNLRWNLEANQEVDNPDFAREVENMLNEDLSHCVQLTYSEWCQRTAWRRFLEWFWGGIDRILLKISEFKALW